MDNNENNNVNLQPNLGSQILMDDTPNTNPQPSVNSNQGMQPNLGSQILMDETSNKNPQPSMDLNQNIQPTTESQPVINDTPINQEVEPQISEDFSNVDKELTPNEPKSDEVDTIFSDTPLEEQPTVITKKKKWPIVVIVLLILGILGLSGYIAYDKFYAKEETPKATDKTEVKETKKEDNTEIEEVTTKKALLKEEDKKVVYSDVDEKHNGVIRRIPYINIDSKYADQVNSEIKELTKNGALEGQVKDHYQEYTVDYQYYINDDIVSVKFSWATEEDAVTHTKIYNINQYTGKKVANTDILKYVNIKGLDLANIMVESYKKARPLQSIENSNMWKESYQKDLDTLAAGNIKALYLNNKELYVVFDLNYPAGSGIGEAILNVTGSKVILNPVTMK